MHHSTLYSVGQTQCSTDHRQDSHPWHQPISDSNTMYHKNRREKVSIPFHSQSTNRIPTLGSSRSLGLRLRTR
eukprot:scaffold165842_cov21-Tisochrysis_lutea.AAC.4